jgi:hypothetical protein
MCTHVGHIPINTPTTQRLRCSQCGAKFLARHAIGEKPCPLPKLNSKAAMKRSAAAEILQRYGSDGSEPNDSLDDLFRN